MKAEILALMQWVLEYSILLSAQLIILLLLRPLVCRYIGAANSYKLWLLPLIWLPFYFINWSQWLPAFADSDATGTISSGLISQAFIEIKLELPIPSLPEFSFEQSTAPGLWLWLATLWVSGVLMLLGKEAYKIIRFNSYVDFTGRPVIDAEAKIILGDTNLGTKIPMLYLKDIESPALYGLFHPVLLLPEDFMSKYDADQRHIILSHEAVHLQRKDNFWNLVACLIKRLFWFNPLLYLSHHYYHLDQELSCDAIALTHCNEKQARHYARTLLASVAQAGLIRHPPIIAAWENPKHLKERIQMIGQHLSTKSRMSHVLLSFLFISLAGAGLTSCVSENIDTQQDTADQQQARRAPVRTGNNQVLSRNVYNTIEEVIRMRDEKDYAGAQALLDELEALDAQGQLNTQERFVSWQFRANLFQLNEDYDSANEIFERILTLPELNSAQRERILIYISSLDFVVEDYRGAIARLEEYNRISREPDADAYYRIGTAHYLLEQFAEAIPNVQRSIQILQMNNEIVPKNTYDLLKALYLSEENYDAAMQVIEESLAIYDEEDDRTLLENIRANAEGIPVNASTSVILPLADRRNILTNAVNAEDIEMLPMVVVEPVYPQNAAANNIEGWILVGFTVSENGDVLAAEVIDAEPETVFDSSAIEAISKFKFNPRIADGEPVAVPGIRYLFRFTL